MFAYEQREFSMSLAAVVLAGTLLGFHGCGEGSGDFGSLPPAVVVEGADALPFRTMSEWVSYADAVVHVRIEAEERVSPTEEELDRGEGLVGRTVKVAVVDVLWSSAKPIVALPKSFEIAVAGSVLRGGKEVPMVISGAAVVTVGGQYVLPIFWDHQSDIPGWNLLSPRAVLSVTKDGRLLAEGAEAAVTLIGEVATASGRAEATLDSLASAAAVAPVLDAVLPHLGLSGRERWAAVNGVETTSES